ncbi:MAG: response regulator [Anaeromyxobacter sp.]|nr:response regulator [Anaeromyxobacter sp.]
MSGQPPEPPDALQAARREAEHYRRIAEEAGRLRLREGEALSLLLARAQRAERELEQVRDELEQRVAARTAELSAANAHLSREVAERERAEVALRSSEEVFRSFMSNFPGLAYIKEADTAVVFANEGFRTSLGLDPAALVGRTNAQSFPEPFATQVTRDDLQVLGSGRAARFEEAFGGRSWTSYKFVIPRGDGAARLGGFTLDVTDLKRGEEERRQLERQVEQAQRLESLGVLAGGIAHDFNNLLTAILGNVMVLRAEAPEEVAAEACLADVEAAARTAASLCQQMLAYAGRAPLATEPIDLGNLVRDMAQLLRSSVSHRLELTVEAAAGLPLLRGSPARLQQVVLNLVINAAEAVGEGAGTVTVRVGAEWAGPERLRQALLGEALPAGRHLVLEVTDTGCGMDQETQRRIFEPFYSSKFAGRGLGLSAVLGIVRQLGGAIEVESAPGRGSRFRVLVPAEPGEVAPAPGEAAAPGPGHWTGEGLALVVDDEPAVRRAAGRLLRLLGFEVLEAPGGAEGVELYQRSAGRIRLVLLDLTMPHLDGVETFRRLRTLDPGACVVIASGHAQEEVAARFREEPPDGIVQKPYELETLRRQLRAVLARRPGRPAASGDRPQDGG